MATNFSKKLIPPRVKLIFEALTRCCDTSLPTVSNKLVATKRSSSETLFPQQSCHKLQMPIALALTRGRCVPPPPAPLQFHELHQYRFRYGCDINAITSIIASLISLVQPLTRLPLTTPVYQNKQVFCSPLYFLASRQNLHYATVCLLGHVWNTTSGAM